MKYLKTIIAILAAAAAIVSCKKDNGSEDKPVVGSGHVYVTASYNTESSFVCGVWIDGERHMLPTTANAKRCSCTGIYIDGNDYYVAGMDDDKACYWKNGVRTMLSSHRSCAFDIIVKDGHVAVCGDRDLMAVVWIDGKETTLSTEEITIPGGMAMDAKGDLYCYGILSILSPKAEVGRIWKVETPFSNPTLSKFEAPGQCINVRSMVFDGSDMHVLLDKTDIKSSYFKNGKLQYTPEGLSLRDMCVLKDGSAVFTGFSNNDAKFHIFNFADNSVSELSSDLPHNKYSLIANKGMDFYAAGTAGTGLQADQYKAAYWTPDGVCHILEPGSDYKDSFTANGIAVK